jgi:hypothetical protein
VLSFNSSLKTMAQMALLREYYLVRHTFLGGTFYSHA